MSISGRMTKEGYIPNMELVMRMNVLQPRATI